MTIEDDPKGWRLDKHISVTFVVMIGLQIAGGIWVAAQLHARQEQLHRDVSRMEAEVGQLRTGLPELITELRVLNARMEPLVQRIERLEGNGRRSDP